MNTNQNYLQLSKCLGTTLSLVFLAFAWVPTQAKSQPIGIDDSQANVSLELNFNPRGNGLPIKTKP